MELTRDEIHLDHQQLMMESGELMAKSTATHISRGAESASDGAHHFFEQSLNSDADDPFAPLHPNNSLGPHDPSELESTGKPADVLSPSKEKSHVAEKSKPMAGQEDPTRWHDAVQFRVLPVVVEDSNDRGVSLSLAQRGNRIKRSLCRLLATSARELFPSHVISPRENMRFPYRQG